jgi:2-polyprenyl-6-methoxyphenol hydroxylase-like FAD-dependent oxidoreductase
MDTLRDLGIEEDCYRIGTTGPAVSHIRWGDSMSGEEYARAWLGGHKPDRWSDYAAASPCRTVDLPQTLLEPLLVTYASRRGFQVRFSTKFVEFREREDGRVVSTLEDLVTGAQFEVVSKFLCGADGGRSTIERQLKLPMVANPGPVAYNILVKAEMTHLMTHRPGSLHYCLRLEKDYPFIPLWRTIKPWHEWILICFPKPDRAYEEPTREYWMEVIRDTINDPSVKAEILDVSRWVINETYATQYSMGNIFCLGDAVHRHPPTGGLGSNTCIQDSFNLFWKLDLVLKGLASPQLLDSYSAERQPVGQKVVERANQALRNYEPIFDTLGVMLPSPQERKDAVAKISRAGEEGGRLRKQLREGLLTVADEEMNALGMEMGQLYAGEDAAVYTLDELADYIACGREAQDPVAFYTPRLYPGRRLPHVWLDRARPAGRISTIDLAGKSAFCLLTGPGGQGWRDAAKTISEKLGGVVINAYTIGFRMDWEDIYGDWARYCEDDGIGEDGCVLARPDLFVAWVGKGSHTGSYEEKLFTVMRMILGFETLT